MADLNHTPKKELLNTIKVLRADNVKLQMRSDEVIANRNRCQEKNSQLAKDAFDLRKSNEELLMEVQRLKKLLERAEDKITAHEQQMMAQSRELDRLNEQLSLARQQRDQARQALVEGTLNHSELIIKGRTSNTCSARPL